MAALPPATTSNPCLARGFQGGNRRAKQGLERWWAAESLMRRFSISQA